MSFFLYNKIGARKSFLNVAELVLGVSCHIERPSFHIKALRVPFGLQVINKNRSTFGHRFLSLKYSKEWFVLYINQIQFLLSIVLIEGRYCSRRVSFVMDLLPGHQVLSI